MNRLTKSDWRVISESLKWSIYRFREYPYPGDYETAERIREERISEIAAVKAKVDERKRN